MFPIFIIMGHGLGATMAPDDRGGDELGRPQRAGLGSAMTNTSREVGGVLGIALLGRDPDHEAEQRVRARRRGARPEPDPTRDRQRRGQARQPLTRSIGLTPHPDRGPAAGVQRGVHAGLPPGARVRGLILLVAAVIANRLIPGRETRSRPRTPQPPDSRNEPGSGRVELSGREPAQAPGLKTMSATTTISTTRSMRDTRKIRLMRCWISGSAGSRSALSFPSRADSGPRNPAPVISVIR